MDRRNLFERIARWGMDFTPEMMAGTLDLYAPLVVPPPEGQVVRDVAYGEDPRHRLDIFRPASGQSGRPVLLFVHGGGFVMGDKGGPKDPFHNNVGGWAARQDLVGVTMTYRLAPGHPWPAGSEDVAAAVRWLAVNIAEHGGDPERIFVMGTSAGAAHVAGLIADASRLMDGAAIAGALMISGIYDVARADRNPFQAAYYGEDEARFADQSTLAALARTGVPCFYSVSEYDPPDFQRQAMWVVEAHVAARQRWPELHWLGGHNHLSSVSQIGCDHDTLGPLIADFIERH